MNRILTVLGMVLAVGVAITLYQVKFEVHQAERQARELNRELVREREAIQVLEAEWSYLNRPARIQDLAERYLGLKPLKASQIGSVETLPMRPLGAPGAGGLFAFGEPGVLPGGVPLPLRKPAAPTGDIAGAGAVPLPGQTVPGQAPPPQTAHAGAARVATAGALEPLLVSVAGGTTP